MKTTNGNTKSSINYNSGKTPNASGAKVGYSAGKSSGTARNGDPKGCAPMAHGKK